MTDCTATYQFGITKWCWVMCPISFRIIKLNTQTKMLDKPLKQLFVTISIFSACHSVSNGNCPLIPTCRKRWGLQCDSSRWLDLSLACIFQFDSFEAVSGWFSIYLLNWTSLHEEEKTQFVFPWHNSSVRFHSIKSENPQTASYIWWWLKNQ